MAGADDPWPDCDKANVNDMGPFGAMNWFNATAEDGTLVFVLHPTLTGRTTFPPMVYSHGATGEYAMYIDAFQRYTSHGFVVIFPHIKSPTDDTSAFTLDPMGGFTTKGVHFAKAANADKSSPFYNKLDLQNLVLAGHSMGATSTLMAASKLPEGTAKVAISQHPGICGPWGPPPCLPGSCNTWMPEDLKKVSSMMPFMLTTATNDGAFWPQPYTAEHELGCFKKSGIDSTKDGTNFVQFSSDICADDGKGGRYDRKWSNGGHDCPMKSASVETPWVLTAAKLYGQLGGNAASTCYALLWGGLQKQAGVEKFAMNAPKVAAEQNLLVV